MAVATQTQDPGTAPMPGHRDHVPPDGAHADAAPADGAPVGRRPDLAGTLRPLAIDIGIPVGTYYLLRDAFGASLWLSLALSSIGPAVRSVAGLVKERQLNLL